MIASKKNALFLFLCLRSMGKRSVGVCECVHTQEGTLQPCTWYPPPPKIVGGWNIFNTLHATKKTWKWRKGERERDPYIFTSSLSLSLSLCFYVSVFAKEMLNTNTQSFKVGVPVWRSWHATFLPPPSSVFLSSLFFPSTRFLTTRTFSQTHTHTQSHTHAQTEGTVWISRVRTQTQKKKCSCLHIFFSVSLFSQNPLWTSYTNRSPLVGIVLKSWFQKCEFKSRNHFPSGPKLGLKLATILKEKYNKFVLNVMIRKHYVCECELGNCKLGS